jgi:transcriptional regulator with XRE-family HTH domain
MLHTIEWGARADYTQSVDDRVAKVLNRLSEEKGLKKFELKKLTGLSRSTLDRHFNGEKIPTVSDRAAYATAFGISFPEFEAMWQPSPAALVAMVRDEQNTSLRVLTELVRRPGLRKLLEQMDLADFAKLELTVREVTLSRVPARRAGKPRNK